MFIEGTITTTVEGRTVHVPFCIDTLTGVWNHWGQEDSGETAELIAALRDTACDRT